MSLVGKDLDFIKKVNGASYAKQAKLFLNAFWKDLPTGRAEEVCSKFGWSEATNDLHMIARFSSSIRSMWTPICTSKAFVHPIRPKKVNFRVAARRHATDRSRINTGTSMAENVFHYFLEKNLGMHVGNALLNLNDLYVYVRCVDDSSVPSQVEGTVAVSVACVACLSRNFYNRKPTFLLMAMCLLSNFFSGTTNSKGPILSNDRRAIPTSRMRTRTCHQLFVRRLLLSMPRELKSRRSKMRRRSWRARSRPARALRRLVQRTSSLSCMCHAYNICKADFVQFCVHIVARVIKLS
jgi:hypothetical protein